MRMTSLIGRQDQIERFEEALADATTGRGSVLLVIGEAGGGKSALLDRFAGIARLAGAAVAWTTVPDTEGAPPFWPWVEILRGLPAGGAQG